MYRGNFYTIEGENRLAKDVESELFYDCVSMLKSCALRKSYEEEVTIVVYKDKSEKPHAIYTGTCGEFKREKSVNL